MKLPFKKKATKKVGNPNPKSYPPQYTIKSENRGGGLYVVWGIQRDRRLEIKMEPRTPCCSVETEGGPFLA